MLSEKTMGQKKDGDNFLNITVADKTGTLKGVIWDNVDQIAALVHPEDFVSLQGHVSEYRGTLQLVIKKWYRSNPMVLIPLIFCRPPGAMLIRCFKGLWR